ncbi:lipid transporter ATP-binding/permease [Endozoicomonas montiporae]|uniref:Lipid transporter ATP-binding/permease n=2 Tax=Endozoicomonas montiporae TaxID=1027273 RepID=A0A081N479_9GAMM|nr:lipid A export permease/ATP-binding protein MsbA [Endozoicomonas montiporae]KEQ13252.1 lipid transporter ATP-binding/permease [Endozoicomonas montiporae]
MSEPAKASGLQIYLRLLTYVKPYTGFFVISLLGYALFALTQPAFARLLEYFVEALEGSHATITRDLGGFIPVEVFASAALIPAVMTVIAILRGIGSFLGNYYLAKVSLRIVHDLRSLMFSHMVQLPNEYFDNNNSGHLIARITYNVSLVTGAATDAIKVVVREGLTVTFLILYLLVTNWKLTLVFFAVGPLIALVVSTASKRFRKLSSKIQDSMGDLTHVSSETINGYRVVRGFGGEDYEINRFGSASKQNTRQNLKMVKASAIHTPTLQLLVNSALAILFFLVLWLKGDATTASLVSFVTAAALLPKPIRQLSEVNANIQRGIAAAESIFRMADEPSESDNGSFTSEKVEGHLEFKNVTFQYPNADRPALDNISFTVEPGQTIALVGRSGSGKTTLANLVPRFYNHGQGKILLDGTDVEDFALRNLRSHIALVDQNVTLFNDTVSRNIAYGSLEKTSDSDIKAAADAAYASEFVANMPEGFDTLVGEDGVLLSGGQRQRLAIARAILKDAPVLILDEATSALDTESERHIQAALEEVMKERTTLVIAHRLSTIENADRILVMDKGQIVETGNHAELLAKGGHYAKLHKLQFKEDQEDLLEAL